LPWHRQRHHCICFLESIHLIPLVLVEIFTLLDDGVAMSLLLASRVAMEAVGIRKEPHSAGLHFRRRPSIYVANEFLLALGKARLLEGRLILLCRTIRASLGLHSPESAHLARRI